jgi:hypothetical protein
MSPAIAVADTSGGGALTGSGADDDESLSTCMASVSSCSDRQGDTDARSSSGHDELWDRGGRSGGGLLEGVGMFEVYWCRGKEHGDGAR